MICMIDIECAECGGNLYSELEKVEGDVVCFKINPCQMCLTNAYIKGVSDGSDVTNSRWMQRNDNHALDELFNRG